MLKLILLISTLAVVAFSEEGREPLSRERRYSPYGYGYPYVGTYAGPGGAYAGAAAGAGAFPFGPSPFFFPRMFPFNWSPFPVFPFPQNWYEGPNVCKEVRTRNDETPNDFNEFLNDEDSPNVNANYNNEQESCKGSNTKFVCIKRITDGTGVSKLQATKYECCHGFVRNPNGAPGCVENAPQQAPAATPAQPKDKYYYALPSNEKYAQKSRSNGVEKSVGKVPAE